MSRAYAADMAVGSFREAGGPIPPSPKLFFSVLPTAVTHESEEVAEILLSAGIDAKERLELWGSGRRFRWTGASSDALHCIKANATSAQREHVKGALLRSKTISSKGAVLWESRSQQDTEKET